MDGVLESGWPLDRVPIENRRVDHTRAQVGVHALVSIVRQPFRFRDPPQRFINSAHRDSRLLHI